MGLLEFDNPFMESQTDLINKVPKEIISEKAATSVKNACSVGKKECLDFATVTTSECQFRPPRRRTDWLFSDPRVLLLCLK